MTNSDASRPILLNWAVTKYFMKKNLIKAFWTERITSKNPRESLGPPGLKVSNLRFSGPVLLYQTNSQRKFLKR